MIEEVPKKPRARASLDGKRLKPVLSEAQQSRIIAERSRLHERAKVLLESDRMSQGLYDTFTDAVNASGSLQELRGVDIDLDKYADQPIDDTAEATAPATESTAESVETDENAETYVAQLYRNKDHVYWYVDKNDAVVELDEDAKIERERQSADPDSPPRAGYPKFSTMAEKKEIPASGSEEVKDAHEPNPTDVDELKRKLEEKNEKKRKKITKELAKKTERPKQPEQTKTPDKQESVSNPAGKGTGEKPPTPPEEEAQEPTPVELHPKERAINRRNYIGLKEKSLKEIWGDAEHQQYFGELVHALEPEAGHDILKRLLAGETTEEDMSFLNFASKEYTKRDRMWSDLTAHMTEQDVEDFKRRNKSLDNIIAFVGKEDALHTLKNVLRHTAMQDEEGFTHIEHAVHHAQSARMSYLGRRADKKMSSLSEDLGIPKEQFADLFDFNNKNKEELAKAKAAAHKKVMARIHAQAGGARKMMDWVHGKTGIAFEGSSAAKADRVVAAAEEAMRGRFGSTGKKFDALGLHLNHAAPALTKILGTADVRGKITKEALTGKPHRLGIELGPTTHAELQKQSAEMNESEMHNIIKERIKQEGPKWESGGRAYQDSILRDMKKKAIEKTAGGGFFAWLLAIIFGTKFNKAASKATGRTVHA